MKRTAPLALAIALIASVAQAQTGMSVSQFLTTANGIPRNPTALLRPDTRRLMNEVKGAFATVRREQNAAQAAGRRSATCMPERTPISADALLRRFNAIPASRRNITVTQAVREWMAAEHPCPA